MTITFLGTGTSQGVPVIACDCPVCLSTDKHDKRLRSSIMIESADKAIVLIPARIFVTRCCAKK